MRKMIEKIIPLWGILPLLCCVGMNMLVYYAAIVICADWQYHDYPRLMIDDMIPLVPEWMYIYWGCYLFWGINYCLVARIHREDPAKFYHFVTTDMMSRIVCGFFFFLLPTTNVRPGFEVDSFAAYLLQMLYQADPPVNLFPSIHCLVSWMCFIGIRGNKKIPVWYQVFSCLFALLVLVSTLTTKQHYLLDGVVGILFAEILYALNRKWTVKNYVQRFFDWIHTKLGLIDKENRIE